MAISIATWIVRVVGIYLGAGIIFSLFFLTRGVQRIDPVAKEATRGFRLLILPGVIALWPLLAKRWLGGQQHPPEECNAHRKRAHEFHPTGGGS